MKYSSMLRKYWLFGSPLFISPPPPASPSAKTEVARRRTGDGTAVTRTAKAAAAPRLTSADCEKTGYFSLFCGYLRILIDHFRYFYIILAEICSQDVTNAMCSNTSLTPAVRTPCANTCPGVLLARANTSLEWCWHRVCQHRSNVSPRPLVCATFHYLSFMSYVLVKAEADKLKPKPPIDIGPR